MVYLKVVAKFTEIYIKSRKRVIKMRVFKIPYQTFMYFSKFCSTLGVRTFAYESFARLKKSAKKITKVIFKWSISLMWQFYIVNVCKIFDLTYFVWTLKIFLDFFLKKKLTLSIFCEHKLSRSHPRYRIFKSQTFAKKSKNLENIQYFIS